jgi:DNA-binding transcriptional MocR family regulator
VSPIAGDALEITLDRDADVPVGVQLAWALRARIIAGALGAGDRLPPLHRLAADAGVNANTVRAVYRRRGSDAPAPARPDRRARARALAADGATDGHRRRRRTSGEPAAAAAHCSRAGSAARRVVAPAGGRAPPAIDALAKTPAT